MSEDAKDEAERIVGDYARIVRSVELELRLDGMMQEHGEALVAVLAAAIEWHDVMIGSMETDEEFVYHSMNSTDIALLQAVSALRAGKRAG